MRYEVPQFIDIKDKIFGPLTFAQFVYLLGGAGLIYMLFRFLPGFIAFIIALPVGIFVAMLAFYKINGRPFIAIVEAAIKYAFRDRMYLWQYRKVPPKLASDTEREQSRMQDRLAASVPLKGIPESKMQDLSTGLNILDKKKYNQ
jgi:hypothetical protein